MKLTIWLQQAFERWLNESFRLSVKSLGIYRILYCLLLLFVIGIPNYTWIAESPAYLYHPPRSLASLFSSFPGWAFCKLLSVSLVLLFVALLFGYRTILVSILLTVVMLVGQNFAYSYGKIDHTILYVLLPLVMSFSGWGGAYSVDSNLGKTSKVNPWTISVMAFLMGFAMFTAGVPKVLGGWLDLNGSAVEHHFVINYFIGERTGLLASLFLNFDRAMVWEFFDYFPIFFEIGFLFAVWRPAFFRGFIFLALGFHLFTGAIFNIFFLSHYGIYLLFIDQGAFKQLAPFFDRYVQHFINWRNLVIMGTIFLLFHFFIEGNIFSGDLLFYPSIVKFIVYYAQGDTTMFCGVLVTLSGFLLGVYRILQNTFPRNATYL